MTRIQNYSRECFLWLLERITQTLNGQKKKTLPIVTLAINRQNFILCITNYFYALQEYSQLIRMCIV